MGVEVGLQLGLLRLRHRVLDQELHLLPQAAADDGVVLVEAERERGAVQHLLADVVPDLRLQLVGGGRAVPGLREARGQAVDVRGAHHDLPVGRVALRPAAAEDGEQHAAEQQEVQQRLAQQARSARHAPQPFGVYQIGEV